MLPFDFHGDTTNHQHYLISLGCHMLVHPSLQVGEPPLDRVGTHAATTYLVGNEDEGGILLGEVIELTGNLL